MPEGLALRSGRLRRGPQRGFQAIEQFLLLFGVQVQRAAVGVDQLHLPGQQSEAGFEDAQGRSM